MAHPMIWKFFDGWHKAQKERDLDHERMVADYAPPAKKKYEECDKRILTLTNQFIRNDPYAPSQSM